MLKLRDDDYTMIDAPTNHRICMGLLFSMMPTVAAALFTFAYTLNCYNTFIATITVFFCTCICCYHRNDKMMDPECPKWRAETMKRLESDYYYRKGGKHEKTLEMKQRDLAELAEMRQRDQELLA